jgi:hypothetical protein
MSWIYQQSTGNLTDPNGNVVATGYSGHGIGINDPSQQSVQNVGPLPQGNYTFGPPHTPIDHLGPLALPLYADPANEMFGRFGFFMHGDAPPPRFRDASDGCIIMPLAIRQSVVDSGDTALTVIA